jgi:alginate O-acetyltransferase complex protein AlgJ
MKGKQVKALLDQSRNMQLALSIIGVVVLFAPMLGHFGSFFNLNYIQMTEKRLPAPIPVLPKSYPELKAYPASVDAYLEDHFGFRSALVTAYNFTLTKLGASLSKKVITGKSGWLYYAEEDMVAQYNGESLFENDEAAQWVQAMAARKAWLAERRIQFIIAVAPNKMTIYPEYLPHWITKINERTRLDQLMSESAKTPSLDLLDLRPSLLAAKNTQVLYYQTDSHWNDRGAFIGYESIVKRIQHYFPEVSGVTPDKVKFSSNACKGLDLAKMLNIAELTKEPNAYKPTFLMENHVLSETHFSDSRYPMKVETKLKGLPRALILRNSFTIPMEPFFNETFSEVIYVDRSSTKFDKDFFEKTNPDIVIDILVERELPIMPHNPVGLRGPSLRITDWGPRYVVKGEPFNKDFKGQFAIWLNAENLSPEVVIVWDQHQLKSFVNLKQEVVTGLVPDALYHAIGKHNIFLLNTKTQEISKPVVFQVRSMLPG